MKRQSKRHNRAASFFSFFRWEKRTEEGEENERTAALKRAVNDAVGNYPKKTLRFCCPNCGRNEEWAPYIAKNFCRDCGELMKIRYRVWEEVRFLDYAEEDTGRKSGDGVPDHSNSISIR